ncbi:MAG: hypothetical protein DSY92_02980, partial [Planctomycetota bacterium]
DNGPLVAGQNDHTANGETYGDELIGTMVYALWRTGSVAGACTGGDCDGNTIHDFTDIAGGALDCDADQDIDSCEITADATLDCDTDGNLDACEVIAGTEFDCDGDLLLDSCEIAAGSLDCNGDLIPDECQTDCNGNSIPDDCDLTNGTSLDCNGNSIPDECDFSSGTSLDCDADGVLDECEITEGSGADCDGDGALDNCEIADGAADCDGNGVPDTCQADCDSDGTADVCAILAGAADCNGNGVPDTCDITGGAPDLNGNGTPDACEPDCNGNSTPDDLDISSGTSVDCNGNTIPDECDITSGFVDCDSDGIPDVCEAADDCDGDGVLNSCEITGGAADCNGNGLPDNCDLAAGGATTDCNGNNLLDSCEITLGFAADCDGDGLLDSCEIAGASSDCNANSVPDECETDTDSDGLIDDCDPDIDGDGILNCCDADDHNDGTVEGTDCDDDGQEDSCQTDTDGDGTIDPCDDDLDGDGFPNVCDIDQTGGTDCDMDGQDDSCQTDTDSDCNNNEVLDACEITNGTATDCDDNGLLDECDLLNGNDTDMNNNDVLDGCECFFINGLTCTRLVDGFAIDLTWGEIADTVLVYRDGELLSTLTGGETSYSDEMAPCSCVIDYSIEKVCSNGVTATSTCTYEWTEPHPHWDFAYTAEPTEDEYQLLQGGAPTSIEVDLCIENLINPNSHCGPALTHAFSMAVSHDPNELTVVDLAVAGEMLTADPDFVSYRLENDSSNNNMGDAGWSLGVIYTLHLPPAMPGSLNTVSFEDKKTVARATYQASCLDWPDGGNASLQFEELWLEDSAEMIDNLVVACGVGYPALVETPSASVVVVKGPAQPLFIRGDCSGQGTNNILEAVLMLNHIFSGTPVSCRDACDVNDDGLLNMVDPVFELMYLMGLGPVPPAPSGVCGADPTEDNLECAISNSGCEDICSFEDCSNGIDDDGDGAVDCDDADCAGTAGCP